MAIVVEVHRPSVVGDMGIEGSHTTTEPRETYQIRSL